MQSVSVTLNDWEKLAHNNCLYSKGDQLCYSHVIHIRLQLLFLLFSMSFIFNLLDENADVRLTGALKK